MRLPPPLILLVAMALVWAMNRYLPIGRIEVPGSELLPTGFFFAGVLAAVAGMVGFSRKKTTVDPLHPERASALVDGGIYRFSRNPMYLGMLLVLIGWIVKLGSLPGLLIAILFVVYMNRVQIAAEERALNKLFGDEFTDYCRRVRRWI